MNKFNSTLLHLVIALFMASIFSIISPAQVVQTGIIHGTVVDEDDEPVAGVYIKFEMTLQNGQNVGTVTNFDGEFRVPGLPAGIYQITLVSDELMFEKPVVIRLDIGQIKSVRLVVKDRVDSQAQRKPVSLPYLSLHLPIGEQNIDDDVLNNLPVQPTLISYVQHLPGVYTNNNRIAYYSSDFRSTTIKIHDQNIVSGYSTMPLINIIPDGFESLQLKQPTTSISGDQIVFKPDIGKKEQISLGGHYLNAPERTDKMFQDNLYYFLQVGANLQDDQLWVYGGFASQEHDFQDTANALADKKTFSKNLTIKSTLRTSERNEFSTTILTQENEYQRFKQPSLAIWDVRSTDIDNITEDRFTSISFVRATNVTRISEVLEFSLEAAWMSSFEETGATSGSTFFPSTIDPKNNILYQGTTNGLWKENNETRIQLSGNVNFYLDEFAGTHRVGLGVDYQYDSLIKQWGYNGLKRTIVLDGLEIANDYFSDIEGKRSDLESGIKSNRFSLFGQDSWQPVAGLSIFIGLRYDGPVIENSFTTTVDWDRIGPNFAVAYDVFADASAFIKLGYSRRFINLLPSQTPDDPYAWGRTFWDRNLQTIGYPIYGELRPRWKSNYNTFNHAGYDTHGWARINEDSDPPRTDDFFMSLEHQPIDNFSWGASLLYQKTVNLVDDIPYFIDSSGNLVLNPDSLWNSASAYDFSGNEYQYWIRQPFNGSYSQRLIWDNDERLFRERSSLELYCRYINHSGFQFYALYTFTSMKGNLDIDEESSSGNSITQNTPAGFANSEGYLSNDIRHKLTLVASSNLPGNTIISGLFTMRTGTPYNKLLYNPDLFSLEYEIRSGPRGELFRNDTIYQFDMRVMKNMHFDKYTVAIVGDIFNVFDNDAVLKRVENDSAAFSQPIMMQLPRSFQLGLQISF